MIGTANRDFVALMENPRNIRMVSILDYSSGGYLEELLDKKSLNIEGFNVDTKEAKDTISSESSFVGKFTGSIYVLPNREGKRQHHILYFAKMPLLDYPFVHPFVESCDGIVLAVDLIEGLNNQILETLQHIIKSRIKILLIISGLGRAIVELSMNGDKIYQRSSAIIDKVNNIISICHTKDEGDNRVSPEKGTVIFGEIRNNWGFCLSQFAKDYSKKFSIKQEELVNKFWGENYYDYSSKEWTTESVSPYNKTLIQGFIEFIINPLKRLTKAVLEGKSEVYLKMLSVIGLTLTPEESQFTGQKLLNICLEKWHPLSEVTLNSIVQYLPSPEEAQVYRIKQLYEGPLDDVCAQGMQQCDPKGPLMARMIGYMNLGSTCAPLFRIFSGRIKANTKLQMISKNTRYLYKEKPSIKEIKKLTVLHNNTPIELESVPCGNIFILPSSAVVDYCTLSDCEEAKLIRPFNIKQDHILHIYVRPNNEKELYNFIQKLKKVSNLHPFLNFYTEDTGEYTISAQTEKCLDIARKVLREIYEKVDLEFSEPFMSYKETITEKSNQECLVKTPNKHNRFWCAAEPVNKDLWKVINGLNLDEESKAEITPEVANKFGVKYKDSFKFWAFGPNSQQLNILGEKTVDKYQINEIEAHARNAFNWTTQCGVLAEEQICGAHFNILNFTLHADTIHRGTSQISPALRRGFYACELLSNPRLMEPVYQVEIVYHPAVIKEVQEILARRNAVVLGYNEFENPLQNAIKAFVPVINTIGLGSDLTKATGGKAVPQFKLDHWNIMDGDPLDGTSNVAMIVQNIRRRKGLRPSLRDLCDLMDKL